MSKKTDPKKLEKTAISAAKKAADILVRYHQRRVFTVKFKGDVNLVTDADTQSEKAVIDVIRKAFSDHEILSEENKDSHAQSLEGPVWVIDPLDGTTNFSHGVPLFAVSIAFRENNQTVFGLVHQPILNEWFVAHRGKGATFNGKKMKVSKNNQMIRSLIGTGFPYDRRVSDNNNLREFNTIEMNCQDLRRLGAATLDLAYVACGKLDGYWEPKLSAWDVAAGALLVEEAGGKVTDYRGNILQDLWLGEVIATNGLIHDQIQDLIATAQKTKL